MSNKMIRYGVVSSVDPGSHCVRVAFEDEDNMVSDWLRVLVSNTKENKDYCGPDVGEDVVCLFLPNGITSGWCIGAFYSDSNPPPEDNPDVRSVTFADGTRVAYDRSTHALTVNCVGAVNIIAAGNVNVTGDVIADGISLKEHIHPESIGTQTGPPV